MYNMRQTHLLKMRTKRSSAAHLPERRRTDNAQKNKPYFAARLSNRRRIETPFWRLVSHTRTKRNLTRRLPARTTTKRKSPSDSQPLPNRTPPHRCAITPQQRNEPLYHWSNRKKWQRAKYPLHFCTRIITFVARAINSRDPTLANRATMD